jgi:nicotinate-nucleotide--dimethylbenzimidazole phosphoribosyltransferase
VSPNLPLVRPLERSREPALRALIDGKAKPKGALGRIEDLAVQIGLITEDGAPTHGAAVAVVFAGDHGVVAEGVTAYPSEVSALIAQMALTGEAGINCAAVSVGMDVILVDAGLRTELPPHPHLLSRRIGAGTANSAAGPAMTTRQCALALEAGAQIAQTFKADGYGILALGEIGIGNSSSAALLAHAITRLPLDEMTGAGAGEPPLGLAHKIAVLQKAFERAPVTDPFAALSEFGGFEMAMLTGALIGAASARAIPVVDGFIATACACAAVAIQPAVRDYLVFAHVSPEKGHAALLNWLNAKPILDLGMRLGEGTGAAMTIPVIRFAERLLTQMADLPS